MQKSREVKIVPYDADWPKMFEEEQAKVKQALGDNCLTVHHIGSTSIPGLAAKPVIDMIPVVEDIMAVDAVPLSSLGYIARGEYGMPFRRYFYKGDPEHRVHLHIFESGNPEIERHLTFRDCLRNDHRARDRYQTLKLSLSEKFRYDIDAYTQAKTAFIKEILDATGYAGLALVVPHSEVEKVFYERLTCETVNSSLLQFVLYKGMQAIGAARVDLASQNKIAKAILDAPYQTQEFENRFGELLERWISQQR